MDASPLTLLLFVGGSRTYHLWLLIDQQTRMA